MEIIRKKISLEPFKSHINGVLPFVGGNGDTNFGEFVYDTTNKTIQGWSGNAEGRIRTCEMMRRYNYLLEILRRSLHLKRLANVNDCNIEEGKKYNKYFSDFNYNNTTEYFFFKEDIAVFLESDFSFIEGKYYINNNGDIENDYAILVSEDDWEKYTLYGGIDYLKEVNQIIFTNRDNEKFNKTPYIPVPILFTCEYGDVGLMTTYFDWFGEKTFKNGNTKEWFDVNISGLTTPGTGFGMESSGLTPTIKQATDVNFSSKITNMRMDKYFYDDNGNVLPGIFKEFSGSEGKFYKCVYRNGVWTFTEYTGNDLKCGDDEDIQVNVKKYRVSTVFETVRKTLEDIDASNGDTYYFLVRYDNSETTPMSIPYSVNVVYNKDGYDGVYTGDYIKQINYGDNTITFVYVIGAVFGNDNYNINSATGGTIYSETYDYISNVEESANIDGLENVKYWYNKIDFEREKEYVTNEDFNLEKQAVVSEIQQMIVGDVWRKDGSVLNGPIFKEDYLMGVSLPSNVDVDVEIDRGNAAAFERHFVLGECNTFEDVAEIHNGFYFNE